MPEPIFMMPCGCCCCLFCGARAHHLWVWSRAEAEWSEQ